MIFVSLILFFFREAMVYRNLLWNTQLSFDVCVLLWQFVTNLMRREQVFCMCMCVMEVRIARDGIDLKKLCLHGWEYVSRVWFLLSNENHWHCVVSYDKQVYTDGFVNTHRGLYLLFCCVYLAMIIPFGSQSHMYRKLTSWRADILI